MPRPIPGGGLPAFVTRLHVRYDARHFPEDLMFKVTQDSSNFQGRYVIRHPWTGQISCPAGQEYLKQLTQRQEREAQTLASLTGWDIQQIRTQLPQLPSTGNQSWKDRIKTIFKKEQTKLPSVSRRDAEQTFSMFSLRLCVSACNIPLAVAYGLWSRSFRNSRTILTNPSGLSSIT